MKQTIITKEFIRGLKFRFMDEDDLQGFWGCDTAAPLICDDHEDYVVVLDGNYCEVYDYNSMEVVDSREDMDEVLRCS